MFCFLRFDNGREKNTARIRKISFWYRFEDFFRNIYVCKFTVSKGTRSHLQVGRLLLPSHIFLLKLQVQDTGCWSSVKLVFLCTRHSWLHGYVQSHPVHIYVWSGLPQSFARRIASYKTNIISLFDGWMFIIRLYINDFQQGMKIFFPSAAMERRKARSFPRPWLPPRPPQDSSPSASTTQPPWRGWAKLDKENTRILWHLLSLENSYFSGLVLKPSPS